MYEHVYCDLSYTFLKKLWCQLSEDGEKIAPKHVGAMYKIICIDYAIVHLLILHELFSPLMEFDRSISNIHIIQI
jgi:hypothetical protein